MGCKTSAFEVAKRSEQFRKDMVQYQAMQLSEREVRKLFNEFRKVDVDGSGSIALPELLAHLDLPVTAFTQKVFSIFDEDGSGEVDFKEFVMTLWNYCTLTSSTLGIILFFSSVLNASLPVLFVLFDRNVCVRFVRLGWQRRNFTY